MIRFHQLLLTSISFGTAVLATSCGGADNGTQPPGPPSGIDIVTGNHQEGPVGSPLPVSPQVRIRDALGNGISGVTIRFDVLTGAGTLTGDSTVTDAQGLASVGAWRLGITPGENTLRAQAPDYPLLTTITATGVPGPPATVQIVSGGSGLSAVTGQKVFPAPSVRVRDSFGNPISEETINWVVTGGAGIAIGNETVTDSEGRTTIGAWQLGPGSGINTLEARTSNGKTALFTANSIGIPVQVEAVSPTTQQGYSSFQVAETPRVRVLDDQGAAVVGIPVIFKLVNGSGSLVGDTATTGPDGVAALGDWRLDSQGFASVEASIQGVPGVLQFTATGVSSAFTIDLRFISPPPANLRDEFVAAASKWMEIIKNDLPNQTLSFGFGECEPGVSPAFNEQVDDVVIFASLTPIDGPGNVLGSAFQCMSRGGSLLPLVGWMTFDIDDAEFYDQTNRFYSIALHEMGHVLGLGTNWNSKGFNSDYCGDLPVYTGANAVAQWPGLGITYSGTPIPIENAGSCNDGTRDVHWSEDILGPELMTGFLEAAGVPTPLSRITIGSLEDLGFQVDYTKAEPFVATLRAGPTGPKTRIHEIIRPTRTLVYPDGSKRRLY